jgi:hypothetical protein
MRSGDGTTTRRSQQLRLGGVIDLLYCRGQVGNGIDEAEPSWYRCYWRLVLQSVTNPRFCSDEWQPSGQDSKVAPVADTRRWLWLASGRIPAWHGRGELELTGTRKNCEDGEKESAWQHTTSESEFRDRPIAQGNRWTAGGAQGAR